MQRLISRRFAIKYTPETSVLEIRESTLAAMLRHSQLNCFIQERGIEQSFTKPDAACVDAPLFGIPVSFKDNICVEGQPVTVGTSAMAACIAPRDAEIVRQLKALGAVVSGKNNMHELSFGITSVNAQWGTVGNPAAPGYCAGGSSGGVPPLWLQELCCWQLVPILVVR